MLKNFQNRFHFSPGCRRSFAYVWFAALIGILSFIPAIPKLIPPHVRLPFSIHTIIILNILQSVIVTAVFVAAGSILAPKIGFKAQLVNVPIKNKIFWMILKRQFYYGVSMGLAGSIIACLIAPEFITYLNMYPYLSRIFGGLTEEVIMRWGFLTAIVWILWRIFQHGIGTPKALLIWTGILLNQILFSIAHTPALIRFGITHPIWSVFTIFMVSLPWGWLFWKQGIEAAFIAHVSFHAFVILFVVMNF